MDKVSVIMPCFNHERFLAESARGILGQTHTDLELIIVNDCSSDNSWDVIRTLANGDRRIRPIRHNRNGGASKSRNDGIRVATGDFIGFCDADDIWEAEKLKFQLGLLQSNPHYDVTYSDATIVDETGQPIGKSFNDLYPVPVRASGCIFSKLVRRNFINIQTVLMRRECVQQVGYFDEGIKWIEDWWYWVRLSRCCRFLYSDRRLAKYRIHSRSTNLVQKRGYSVNRFKVFRRMLRQFRGLPRSTRADLIFNMAVELQNLGMARAGKQLLWSAIGVSLTDLRALLTLVKALRRMIVPSSLGIPYTRF